MLAAFSSWWLQGQDLCFEQLLDMQPHNIRKLNNLLLMYGRQLFEAGWPFSHYSEVINAIAGREPSIRRSLQPLGTWLLRGCAKNRTRTTLHFLGSFFYLPLRLP